MNGPDFADLTTEQVLKLLSARDSVAVCLAVAQQLVDPQRLPDAQTQQVAA